MTLSGGIQTASSHGMTYYHQVHKNDEVFAISTNQIYRFSAQRLGLCEKKIGSTCSRQTAPKRVRRNRGQIRRFRELDGICFKATVALLNSFKLKIDIKGRDYRYLPCLATLYPSNHVVLHIFVMQGVLPAERQETKY